MDDEVFAISVYGNEIYYGEDGIREIHGEYYRPGEALLFLNEESDPVDTTKAEPYHESYIKGDI